MRIWIARAEMAALRTAERVRAMGHEPLVAPVSVIAPTADAVPQRTFDAVLLTSANAVDSLARLTVADTPIFAVGRKTAQAARSASFANVVAADGNAAALTALVRDTMPIGAALLHVAGSDRKVEPGSTLERAGYEVTVWTAYAAVAAPELPPKVRAALAAQDGPPLDVVLHYSRRSAQIALSLAREAGLAEAFGRLRHHCLSVDVAAPLVEAGIPAHFASARPDEDSLLAGLDCSG